MNAHTKQQQDKVFETDFIDSQKSDPPFAHLLALSHISVQCVLTLVQFLRIKCEYLYLCLQRKGAGGVAVECNTLLCIHTIN